MGNEIHYVHNFDHESLKYGDQLHVVMKGTIIFPKGVTRFVSTKLTN